MSGDQFFSVAGGVSPSVSSEPITACAPALPVASADVQFMYLPPESDNGHIEYKRKLVNVSPDRLAHLITQLKFRVEEGGGEAIYEIGVEDDGKMSGLPAADMEESIRTLNRMAAFINCETEIRAERAAVLGKTIEVVVRRCPETHTFVDVRVAALGNVDAGKSTTLGVLTRGSLDDGRGLARQHMFHHRHEVETGRTSTISMELLGFDNSGTPVNYACGQHQQPQWSDICRGASKVVTFIDLAGHEKYLKTTLFGLLGNYPDYAMMIVGANMGLVGTFREHLALCIGLRLPFFMVVTKIDMCPPNILDQTMTNLTKTLKSPGVRKIPMIIKSVDDVIKAASNVTGERVTPIFQVSNVSGTGLDLLRMFLNLLSSRAENVQAAAGPAEVHIDGVFSVTGVGTVVAGTVIGGRIRVGDKLLLGPDSAGQFQTAQIKSIHLKRSPVDSVSAGVAAAFSLRKVKKTQVRKGMILAGADLRPKACYEFDAEILVLHHSTTIRLGYESVLNCGTVHQTARVVELKRNQQDAGVGEGMHLRSGDTAIARLQFVCHPEYVKPGMRLVFREGNLRGIGRVLGVHPLNEK